MPELPEVEVTKKALEPFILNQTVQGMEVYNPSLRYPIEPSIHQIVGQSIIHLARRAKYLIFQTPIGFLQSHLGMTGRWQVLTQLQTVAKHDCLDIIFNSGTIRYNDVRRFGFIRWFDGQAQDYFANQELGVEPISNDFFVEEFNTDNFYNDLKSAKSPIKTLLMNNKIVVGVGNIYANEALFKSGIHPKRKSHQISKKRIELLRKVIIQVLSEAIKMGGTTLNDFYNPQNKQGYFQLSLSVYGRENQPCLACTATIKRTIMGGRSTFYCPNCQK